MCVRKNSNLLIFDAGDEVFFGSVGTVIEVYAATLHFCPFKEREKGFGVVVVKKLY